MSYLDVPRLHFAGRFVADPSTVNNNNANYDPTARLTSVAPDTDDPNNTSVYWNPNGTHNWELLECTVRGAANAQGPFAAPSNDPLIGASVLSVPEYPAKIVDLDPDAQSVSQIWGLRIEVRITGPGDPTKALGSVAGTMPPTAFCDLWNRTRKTGPGMRTMSAAFHGVLRDLVWVTPEVSPLLAALRAVSPNALSIRFNVDSYQPSSLQANFRHGRVVGTIGPRLPGDAPRSSPRRIAPAMFFDTDKKPPTTGGPPSIFSLYGPVNASWNAPRGVLTLDMGNSFPTDGSPPPSGPSVPVEGWPVIPATLQLNADKTVVAAHHLKSGAAPGLATIAFDTNTYLTYAGVVEVPIAPSDVPCLASPLSLTDPSLGLVNEEDAQGRYVDVDAPFFRLDPGDVATLTLWATKFGQPWANAALDLALLPAGPAGNGPQPPKNAVWQNGEPQGAVRLSAAAGQAECPAITVTTGADGTATVVLAAGDPGRPRMYPNGEPGPDGQVYQIMGPWAKWGQIFLFPGAPINVLVFSAYALPAQPTWAQHVGPILSNYARMYPYMKGILDIGDYDTVVGNAADIDHVLNVPREDPHHMPIVRDLSRDKLAMINKWLRSGTPR